MVDEIIEPSNYKERYEEWKTKEKNSIIKEYIIESEKNKVGYSRLLANISRLNKIQELIGIKDLTKVKEEQLRDLFYKMNSGKINKANGEMYSFSDDYIKRFKAFWHWYMKKCRKQGKELLDITSDFKMSKKKKAKFVYFTNEQLEKMLQEADYDMQTLMLFLFDTGIRSPKELINVRASDIINNSKELLIREESSKTFGRRIKLMLCSDKLKKYMQDNNLSGDMQLFPIIQNTINKRLKKIGKKILGDNETLGRARGNDLTMYDFRHSSACYWLPKYKSISALLYRFGWKKEEEIHYYTQLLGMKDTITEEDMLIDGATRSIIEKRLIYLEKEVKRISNLLIAQNILDKLKKK